jgi:molybdopterin adenylyltransferase
VPGRVVSVNTSLNKGDKKTPVTEAVLLAGHGVEGDAHAGGPRQVSLLANERVSEAAAAMPLKPGDFGENITTEGFDPSSLCIGERVSVGPEAILQVSGIGKICESPCSIGQRLGDCIMPVHGVFAKVVKGGRIAPGDLIEGCSLKAGAVLTASDRCSRGEREDESGPLLVDLLNRLDVVVAECAVMPDDEAGLSDKLRFWSDECALDLVVTTGGTGFSKRDRMPEATLAVLTSAAPGIAEGIRHEGLRHTPHACLSRAVSGLRGRTLIINLPGSPGAVTESLDFLRIILPHVLETIRGETIDCGIP